MLVKRIVLVYLYILESETTGQYYIGQTAQPDKRLSDHNRGAGTFTRGRGPWVRVFLKPFDTRSEALALEKRLKAMKSHDRVKAWINRQPVG